MKKGSRIFSMLLAVILLMSLTACGSNGKYVLGQVKFDKDAIGVNDSAVLKAEVKDSAGKTQVNGSVKIKVMVAADSDKFEIKPVTVNAEEITGPGQLQENLKPGAVLPRNLSFQITPKGAPAGEYTFKVTLDAGAGEEVQTVKLKLI